MIATCWTCRHALFGEAGTYCPIYSEPIDSEVLAGSDCPSYDSSEEVSS